MSDSSDAVKTEAFPFRLLAKSVAAMTFSNHHTVSNLAYVLAYLTFWTSGQRTNDGEIAGSAMENRYLEFQSVTVDGKCSQQEFDDYMRARQEKAKSPAPTKTKKANEPAPKKPAPSTKSKMNEPSAKSNTVPKSVATVPQPKLKSAAPTEVSKSSGIDVLYMLIA